MSAAILQPLPLAKERIINLPIPYGWYALTYSAELAPGDVQPLFNFDEHQVLFRTEQGEARLMEAFCPHLGAHLGHGGEVQGESIACPFHGWRFDGNGVCVEVPYASATPKRLRDTQCLYSYPVQERNQMVWAWYHPRRLPPLFDLDDIPELADPEWSELDTYEWDINACIQETGENAVDTAHFVYVHGAATKPQAKITLAGCRRKTDMVTQSYAIDDDGNIDMERMEDMHLISKSCGPGMTTQVFSRAFKTVMLGAVTPITANRLKLRFAFTKPLNISEKFNMLTDGLIAEIVRQVQHDIPIWENKIYRESPILCDGDGPISKYRKWFSQFYDDPEADSAKMRLIS